MTDKKQEKKAAPKEDVRDTLKNQTEEVVENPEEQETTYATEEVKKSELLYDVVDEFGLIAEDTVISGDVSTHGHLAIAGTVGGNVSAKGNVIISGVVNGKIKCQNLVLEECTLTTNIETSGTITVKAGSQIIGNIKCKDISVDGMVSGDIEVEDTLVISKHASVKGNIKAKSIGMEFGGKISGDISMHDEF